MYQLIDQGCQERFAPLQFGHFARCIQRFEPALPRPSGFQSVHEEPDGYTDLNQEMSARRPIVSRHLQHSGIVSAQRS